MRGKFFIILGSLFVLFVLGICYYEFFVPKVGPIGDGKISPISYVNIICALSIGIITIIRGILIIIRK